MAILAVIMLLVTQMIGDTSKLWKGTSARIDAFQQARLGFQLMTSEISQATTNTHWDYFDASGNTPATATVTPFSPVAYGRQSELHFFSGPLKNPTMPYGAGNTAGPAFTHTIFFQCPTGQSTLTSLAPLKGLLNGTGFFVEFSPDVHLSGGVYTPYVLNGPPTGVLSSYVPKYRFRLMQFVQQTEGLLVYNYSLFPGTDSIGWFENNLGYNFAGNGHQGEVRIVANNVIALIVWPKKINTPTDCENSTDTPLAPNYTYDSRGGLKSGSATTTASGIWNWTPGTQPQPLQLNQMPPILRIAMVAIDEPSAQILQGSLQTMPPKIPALFTSPSAIFAAPTSGTGATRVDQMDLDLATLQTRLSAISPRINYQIFTTTVAIRSAKFANP